MADGADRFGVQTIHFDPIEELIWMGNQGLTSTLLFCIQQFSLFLFVYTILHDCVCMCVCLFAGGHVTSYYGAEMQKYTSFQVHPTESVRQIEFLDDGILCLTETSLRYQLRRGIPKKTHRSKSMINTHCMLRFSPEKLLISGHQDKLIEFDLTTFAETSTVSFNFNSKIYVCF